MRIPVLNKYQWLSVILAAFMVTRLIVLLTSIEPLFNSEDLAMGAVAKEVAGGTSLGWFELPYLTYSGGTLVVGLLAAPFFMLLGPSYFALKMVPLLFSAGSLTLLFLFAWRFFSRRTAVLSSLLYIFSVSVWGGFNLFLGFHVESLFFILCAVYLSYAMVYEGKRGIFRCCLLGLICGFGVYFSYTFLVCLAALLVFWLVNDRRFFVRREFVFFFAGFLAGFSPWIIYNLGCNFRGITDVMPGGSVSGFFSLQGWGRLTLTYLRSLWFTQLLGFKYLGVAGSRIYAGIYTAVYWISFIYVLVFFRRSFSRFLHSREFLFIIFPLLWLASATVYGVVDEGEVIESRYLVGLYPCIFLTVAMAFDRICAKFRFSSAGSALVGSVAAVACIAVFTAHMDYSRLGSALRMPGYSYFYLAETFNYRHSDNPYKMLDDITCLGLPQRHEVLTTRLAFDYMDTIVPVDFDKYKELALRLDPRYRPCFYTIVAHGLFYSSPLAFTELAERIAELADRVEPAYRAALYEGAGAIAVKRHPDESGERFMELAACIPADFLPAYYRGISHPVYEDDIPAYVERCGRITGGIPAPYLPYYLDGVGDALAKFAVTTFIAGLSYNDKGLLALYDFIRGMDDGARCLVLTGAGRGISYYYDENTKHDISHFIDDLSGRDRARVLEAMAKELR